MARFFSYRLAPGLRVSASSRGVRAHVGPRIARLHVGGGRTGVSTGAGPFTWYEHMNTASGKNPPVTQGAANEADAIRQQLDNIYAMHRLSFPERGPQEVSMSPLPWFSVLIAEAEKEALRGVSRFDRRARREARNAAHAAAEERARELLAIAIADRSERQMATDAAYANTTSSSDQRLLESLKGLSREGGGELTVDQVEDRVASVHVYIDPEAAVPTRKPVETAAGNLSLPKVTKTERCGWIRELAAAYALLAAKEVLTYAPGLTGAVISIANKDKRGKVVLRCTLTRSGLHSARWDQEPWQVLNCQRRAKIDPFPPVEN